MSVESHGGDVSDSPSVQRQDDGARAARGAAERALEAARQAAEEARRAADAQMQSRFEPARNSRPRLDLGGLEGGPTPRQEGNVFRAADLLAGLIRPDLSAKASTYGASIQPPPPEDVVARLEQWGRTSDAEIESAFHDLHPRFGYTLPPAALAQLHAMAPGGPKRMLTAAALEEMRNLQQGRISPSEYQFRMMEHAANVKQFVDSRRLPHEQSPDYGEYINFMFNNGDRKDVSQTVAGLTEQPVGFELESMFNVLTLGQNGTQGGYNLNAVDVDPNSTVTHHFAAFFAIASHDDLSNIKLPPGETRESMLVQAAVKIDSADSNPGDVRNAFFATMLGTAYKNGQITAQEAAEMTRWAYGQDPSVQPAPPWGYDKASNAPFTSPETYKRDYDFGTWLSQFRQAKASQGA